MWKYFIPGKRDTYNISTLNELRGLFPDHEFIKDVSWKGNKGTVCVPRDWSHNREYGEHYPSTEAKYEGKEVEFWEPTPARVQEIKDNLDNYYFGSEQNIPIRLGCGQIIKISPARAIPKKVLFGKPKIKKELSELESLADEYNTAFEYGKAAYDMLYYFEKAQSDLSVNDPAVLELIEMGLRHSYNLPIDMMNIVLDIAEGDLAVLFLACMGDDLDFIIKKKMNTLTSDTSVA